MKKLLTLLALIMNMTNPLAAHGADAPVVPIQQLKTPSGIEVWLVESHTLPMVSVEVAFKAGAVYDPQGKQGLANLTATMLTQGGSAGLSSEDFLKQTERLGAAIGADADRQTIGVSLQALSENIDEAFGLYADTLKKPEFNPRDFSRVQEAFTSSRKRIQENPSRLAEEAFAPLVYGRTHPYAHPTIGTDYSLPKLTQTDVVAFYKDHFNQQNMVVSIVGDITPQKAVELVETHLASLPKGKIAKGLPAPKPQPPVLKKISADVPQTSIIMGHKGLSRAHKDYFSALLMNHIFGSGGFSSILMEEIREKRGLAYGIHSFFEPLPHWGAYQISVKTKNESAYEVVELVKKEVQKLIENGVTDEAYSEAMDYMVGSFPLRLDSNNDILSYLTFMQVENLGVDYLDKWLENMRSVTREAVHQAAKNYLKPEDMIVVMVGQPDASPQKPTKEKFTPLPAEVAAPKAVAAPAKVEKPAPAEDVITKNVATENVATEDVTVEEEAVSAEVKTVTKTSDKVAPVTVVPNPNAGKIIIPDDPEKLKLSDNPPPPQAKPAPSQAAAAQPAAKKEKINLDGLQILKDPPPPAPRKRRNVDAKEWL